MGLFSWNCAVCGRSILHDRIASDKYSHATVITPVGSVVRGRYDGYGRVGGHQFDGLKNEATWYHTSCWVGAGKPMRWQGDSEPALDQGHFLGEDWEGVDLNEQWELPDLSPTAYGPLPFYPQRMGRLPDMEEALLQLVQLAHLDHTRSAWTASMDPGYLLTRLEEEIVELRRAWQVGLLPDMVEEMGDVLTLALKVAFKLDQTANASDMGPAIRKKCAARTPWIFEEDPEKRPKTAEEEGALYIKNKMIEKGQLTKGG